MKTYDSGKGSNPHHTRALVHKEHGWSTVNLVVVKCPRYLLDTIETFLIAQFDLMDPNKGYNKQSGSRNNWTVSKETRAKTSLALKGRKKTPEHAANISSGLLGKAKTPEHIAKFSGENSIWFGKRGSDAPAFGNTFTKTPEQIAKTSGENSIWFGKRGSDAPAFGNRFTKTPEKMTIMFGTDNGMSRPVCVFGKVYPYAKNASNILRTKHAPNNKGNFISQWTRIPKHQSYTFYVTKDFYAYAIEYDLDNITRELYDIWYAFHFI